jgi:hypothetical protein
MFRSFSRRDLFEGAFVATPPARSLESFPSTAVTKSSRTQATFELRKLTALVQCNRPITSMASNGDESNLPNRIACFARGLPQNQFLEVESTAYDALLAAIKSGKYATSNASLEALVANKTNPQAACTLHAGKPGGK